MIAACESLVFEEVHEAVLHLLPQAPARVLDIGTGSGRDAAAFAALGHTVVAIEPVRELRTWAASAHRSANIDWVDDLLPELKLLESSQGKFDLILIHAVWMHLNEAERAIAMRRVADLVASGGTIILSLRHGPIPQGKHMHEVSAEETIGLANQCGLKTILHLKNQPSAFPRKDVTWSRLAFT